MHADSNKRAVLHVALQPLTGAWSVMRELCKAQANSGLYQAVGMGVIADAAWPAIYAKELSAASSFHYLARTIKMFGTGQDLWQLIKPPPIDQWVADLLGRSGSDQCIIHFHNAWISGVFLPLRCVKQKQARVVATFHGVNVFLYRQRFRREIHRWMAGRLMKYGAVLTSVDRANLSQAQKVLAMNPDDFQVVPNGTTDTELRGCPRLSGHPSFTLGHIGSMISIKGWQMLVDAARALREQGHEINVILAGRGDGADLATTMAQKSGGWLRYEGFVANPRESVLPKVDVLVLMSEHEGLPMAIIEALSMGVPVVATPVGGVPEAVAHSKNGLLIVRSVGALVAALKPLLTDQNKLREMSLNARHMFESRFEISRVVSMYDEVYRIKT
jgi:glycosyltransferase involved in cell wall biosynthesis